MAGATASLLLECDESQDVDPVRWDKDLVPMGATGNATQAHYGTPWADDDLLARTIAETKAAQKRDGLRRHFEIGLDEVTACNPLYGRFVAAQIERLGESHPIIQTQYLLKQLARAGRLFSAEQLAALEGDHPPELAPKPGAIYVPESRGHDDHLNAAALLTQAVKIGSLRQAVGRSGRPTAHGPFGNDRSSRR